MRPRDVRRVGAGGVSYLHSDLNTVHVEAMSFLPWNGSWSTEVDTLEAVLALSAREKYDTEKKTQRSLPQRLGPFVTIILRAQLHWEYL